MAVDLSTIFALLLSLLGPAPAEMPKELILKQGDQIVAIGDSITQGGGYLKQTDAVLAAQYPDLKLPKIVNVGISGQKAEDLVKRFDKDVVQKKPAAVTISIGINDVWHRLKAPHDDAILARYKENLGKMVDMAKAANIKVILLAPTVIQEDPQSEGNKRLPLYVGAMRDVAKEKGATFVDLHQMFIDTLAKKPPDAKTGKGGNWLTGDGVHMNTTGNALMAIGVLRGLGVPDEKITVPTASGK